MGRPPIRSRESVRISDPLTTLQTQFASHRVEITHESHVLPELGLVVHRRLEQGPKQGRVILVLRHRDVPSSLHRPPSVDARERRRARERRPNARPRSLALPAPSRPRARLYDVRARTHACIARHSHPSASSRPFPFSTRSVATTSSSTDHDPSVTPLCRPRPALDLDLGWTRGTCAIITSHDSSWSRLCTRTREYSRRAVSFHSFHSIHFMHSFIPLEVSVGRRRVRRRSSCSSISSRRRTATGRDDRPARSSAVMGLSRRACLSLSLAMSLSRDVSLRSRARARHRRRVRVLLSVLERVLERAHASTHARTNARTHPFMHSFMHPRIIGADIATTSRMDLEGCATRDVVTRRRRASRDARERGERERREVSISESRDRGRRRATTPRRRFDSIRFRHLILI